MIRLRDEALLLLDGKGALLEVAREVTKFNLRLRSGLANPLRAIDLADVIGLIRARRLTPAFASQIHKELRPEFRKLVRAIQEDLAK